MATVNRKDRQQNDILLVSTGLPDKLGYVMTGDRFVFKYLHDLLTEGLSLNPVHLDQVILHHWGSGDATLLYQRPGAPGLVDNSAWAQVN